MRKLLILLLLIFVSNIVANAQIAETNKDFDELYNQFRKYSSEELETKGLAYMERNENDSASICYLLITTRYADNLSKIEKQRCARAYKRYGVIHSLSSSYQTAYTNFLKSLDICEELAYKDYIPNIYNNISFIFGNYGDMDMAGEYYKKAYEQSLQNKDWSASDILVNLISLYYPIDSLHLIEDELREFGQLDFPKDNLHKYTLSLCNGMIHVLNQDYEQAIDELIKSTDYLDGAWMSVRYLNSSYAKIAKTYTLMNRYDLAIDYLKKGEALALENNMADLKVMVYRDLADCYEKAGSKEVALEYKAKYLHLNDSIFNAKGISQIKNMHSGYAIDKIEIKVKQLTAEQKMKNWILAIVSSGLVIIGLLLIWAFRQNKRLAEKNKELFRKNVEVMQSEQKEKQMRKESDERKPIEPHINNEEEESDARYRSSTLSDEYKAWLLGEIRMIMDDTKNFCATDFTVEKLAKRVNSKSKYVSQAINEGLGKNFSAFLNEYRISEARERLLDFDNYGNMTIEAIAKELGFKSRSNFVHVFKKVTGLTPTEYQRMAKRMRS